MRVELAESLHEFTKEPSEETLIQQRLQRAKITRYITEESNNISGSEYISEYGQETNEPKRPEDNQWRPYPAQANLEG